MTRSYIISVARFNEDVSWLVPHAREYATVYVYNKGAPLPEEQAALFREVAVPNVGLDGYCLLRFITDHYDTTLAGEKGGGGGEKGGREGAEAGGRDVRVAFVQANLAEHFYATDPAKFRALFLDHAFMTAVGTSPNIIRWPVNVANFFIDSPDDAPWAGGATMLDFWTRHIDPRREHRPPPPNEYLWYKNMMFGATAAAIRRRPKQFYLDLLADDVAAHRRSQVLHYLERAWFYIMHPEWSSPEYMHRLGTAFCEHVENCGFDIREPVFNSEGVYDFYRQRGLTSPALLRFLRAG
jgi:hypothetical protein